MSKGFSGDIISKSDYDTLSQEDKKLLNELGVEGFNKQKATEYAESAKAYQESTVTLDNGDSFRCTPDHRIMLRNGNYIEAQDLESGVSLMPFNSYKREDRSYRMITSNTGRDIAQYRFVSQYYDITKDG